MLSPRDTAVIHGYGPPLKGAFSESAESVGVEHPTIGF